MIWLWGYKTLAPIHAPPTFLALLGHAAPAPDDRSRVQGHVGNRGFVAKHLCAMELWRLRGQKPLA